MANVLFIKSNSKLSIENHHVVVTVDVVVNKIPVHEISCILIESQMCSVTVSVNILCANFNIPIIYCNSKHQPVASTVPMNGYYRQLSVVKQQIKWSSKRKENLYVKIIKQKCCNQLELLRYLKKDDVILVKVGQLIKSINNSNYIHIEASVAKIYFKT